MSSPLESLEELRVSLDTLMEKIGPFVIIPLLILLFSGMIYTSISDFMDQGDSFGFPDGYYGPDSPEFAGDVIWEGNTDDLWTVGLKNDPGEIRVWVEEGKSVDVSVSTVSEDFDPRGASFERCDDWECNYYNNANESIPGYEYIGQIDVRKNRTYDVQFIPIDENNETVMVIVTKETFPTPGIILVAKFFGGVLGMMIFMKAAYHTAKEMRAESEQDLFQKQRRGEGILVAVRDGDEYWSGVYGAEDATLGELHKALNEAREFWIYYLSISKSSSECFVQYSRIEGLFEHWEGGEMVYSEKGDSAMAISYYMKIERPVTEEDNSEVWWKN